MFIDRLKTVITASDIITLSLALLPIAVVLIYTFVEVQYCWVQYLERLVKASPVLPSSAVAFMFWQWYRNSLKERIRYCHEHINRPLYKALYGTVSKSESNPSSIVVRKYSIKERVYSYSSIAGDLYVDKVAKDKEDLEKRLRWYRAQEENLRLIRNALSILSFYKNLYPKSIQKDLNELFSRIEEYDRHCHEIYFLIFKSLRKHGVPEDWLDAAISYVRTQLELGQKTGLERYKENANRVVKELKGHVNKYKEIRKMFLTFLNKLKEKFDRYLIALGLDIPETMENEMSGLIKEV